MTVVIVAVHLLSLLPLQPPPLPDRGALVSLVAVLSRPYEYDGKRVALQGWCVRSDEESGLYLTQEDAQYGNASSALWLEVDPVKFTAWKKGASWRCIVEGRVDTKDHGHLGAFAATLADIRELYPKRSRTTSPR